MQKLFPLFAGATLFFSLFTLTSLQTAHANGLVSAGLQQVCAITSAGTQCWGRGGSDAHASSSNVPVALKGASRATALAVGGPGVTCFLAPPKPEAGIKKTGSDLYCRGSNLYGLAKGNGTYNGFLDTPIFVDIWDVVYERDEQGVLIKKDGKPIIIEKIGAEEVAIGGSHILVRLTNGTVKSWGEGWGSPKPFGALGRETHFAKKDAFKALPVPGFQGAISIAAGTKFSCAVLRGGAVRCTGDNSYGSLGDGNKHAKSELPVDVQGITNAISVHAGGQFACALLTDGSVTCWGSNSTGESGDGATFTKHLSPVAVKGLRDNVIAMDTGSNHVCAILADHTVQCWGKNVNGQLGNNVDLSKQKNKTSNKPVDVVELSSIEQLSLGGDSSCARKSDGQILCWGDDTYGQLGDGKGLKVDLTQKKKTTTYLPVQSAVPVVVQF